MINGINGLTAIMFFLKDKIWNLYDAGISVHLITGWPSHIKPDKHTETMVSWIDIFPALLDIIGCQIPANLDGKSFKRVLEGKTYKHWEYVFTTHRGDGIMNVYPIHSIGTKRYKYILNVRQDYYQSNPSDIRRKQNAGGYWDSWDEAVKTDRNADEIIRKYCIRLVEKFYDIKNDPFEQYNLIENKAQKKY